MALQRFKNFAVMTMKQGYDSAATSVVVTDKNRVPSTPFRGAWYNATDHADSAMDDYREIVECTAKVDDSPAAGECTLTITRAQEGTSAQNHNTAGKTYRIINSLTASWIDLIGVDIAAGTVQIGDGSPVTEMGINRSPTARFDIYDPTAGLEAIIESGTAGNARIQLKNTNEAWAIGTSGSDQLIISSNPTSWTSDFIVRVEDNLGQVRISGDPTAANSLLILQDLSAFASGVGGGIRLSGKVNAGGTEGVFAAVRGVKVNATTDDYTGECYIAVNNDGSVRDVMRLTSSGYVEIVADTSSDAYIEFDTDTQSWSAGNDESTGFFTISLGTTLPASPKLNVTAADVGLVMDDDVPADAVIPGDSSTFGGLSFYYGTSGGIVDHFIVKIKRPSDGAIRYFDFGATVVTQPS